MLLHICFCFDIKDTTKQKKIMSFAFAKTNKDIIPKNVYITSV